MTRIRFLNSHVFRTGTIHYTVYNIHCIMYIVYDKTFRGQSYLEFSSSHFGSKIMSIRPFWKILAFDHIWTWAWPSRSPWGRWQMPPPLIWLVTIKVHLYQFWCFYQKVHKHNSAKNGSLSALLLYKLWMVNMLFLETMGP